MGMVLATLYLSLEICWQKPNWADELELRCLVNFIKFKLSTIHPNPGPGRDKTEEGRKRRRERRYQKRKDNREARLRREDRKSAKKKYTIVTWNVQRMTLRDYHKRKAKRVAEYVRNQKWDAVLLSEVLADKPGVVWLGDGRDLTAIVHSEKAGVLLQGELLEGWNRGGQKKMISERSVSVNVNGMVLTATYLPVFIGTNNEQIDNAKDILAKHVKWSKKEEIRIGGGDFNAHVGSDEEAVGSCGRFGLRSSNRKGRELIQWCEEQSMCYVNSFYNHKMRGTWFNRMNGNWYELDGFLMDRDQRHRIEILKT